jgi:flavodoxin
MKILIVYYSRDGHTRTIAKEMSSILAADIEEIREMKKRKGIIGWLSAGQDSFLKRTVVIENSVIDPTNYDLVIIGTPVWAWTMSPGVRAWLKKYGKNLKKVIFFVTMGGSGDKRTFADMTKLCANPPLLTASFIDKTIDTKWYQAELDKFLREIREKHPI